MSQSLSRRSFLKCAGSGAVSLAAALLTGVSAAGAQPRAVGQPALLDGKAAVELLGYAPAPGLNGVLVYLSVENLSARTLPVGASYLHSRDVSTLNELYSLDSGVTARCGGQSIPCGSFAAPLYAENAADASAFTLNLAAGRGAMLHCFCAVPGEWETLGAELSPRLCRRPAGGVRGAAGCRCRPARPGARCAGRSGERSGPVRRTLRFCGQQKMRQASPQRGCLSHFVLRSLSPRLPRPLRRLPQSGACRRCRSGRC